MKKLSEDIRGFYQKQGRKNELARMAQRAAQVRAMWAGCVQDYILEHTNSVYIVKEDESQPTAQLNTAIKPTKKTKAKKTLIVYVDDSICATELNARRELIKLKLLQDFKEDVDEIKIVISRGAYKKNYPFRSEKTPQYHDSFEPIPLTKPEAQKTKEVAAQIEDPALRKKFLEAMTADLEWKKAAQRSEKEQGGLEKKGATTL